MDVLVDNVTFVAGLNVISLTTPSFEIAGDNRVGVLGLSQSSNGCTGFSASLGGISAALIAGTDSGEANASRSQMWVVVAPPTGSQTGTIAWTGATWAFLGVATMINVRQTTPATNGTFAVGTAGHPFLTINSATGDMTLDTVASGGGPDSSALSNPTQTQRWNGGQVTFLCGGGSSAPGAASNDHEWVTAASDPLWASSGANFVQAGVGQQVMGLYNPHPMVI